MCRAPAIAAVYLFLVAFTAVLRGQSTNASVSGRVTDSSKAVIVDARVSAISLGTNLRYETMTNSSGEYSLASLPPNSYRIEVEKNGFKKLIKRDVVLHVQDSLAIDFEMPVGSASESITVESGAPLLNTSDATVSTLVDNRFVENMPLNGRSFSGLIDLTPGVVLVPTNFFEEGQFSVNGQRPDANYFTVDGVSANLGTPVSSFVQGGAGQVPATNAFGGFSNLVSLDALQEFRIQTSTFAPEFGRAPGAQISIVTKSGTNTLHGTAFEYLRNDVFDANNWFANNKGLKKPELRQNDFGGVLGGPLIKDKLFFFGSYEGVRVRQPQIADTYVPDLASRQSAPAKVQPLLDAFPKPTGSNCPNCPPGTAAFAAGYSDPSSLDSYSGRGDYVLSRKVTLFGRYSDAPSSTVQRGGGRFETTYSNLNHTRARTQTATVGADETFTPHLLNDLRFNYSLSRGQSFLTLDNFAGAVAPPDSVLLPTPQTSRNSFLGVFADLNPFGLSFDFGSLANNVQHQVNVTDTVSWGVGAHEMKFGLDYRRLRPAERSFTYLLEYEFLSLANVLSDSVPAAFVGSRTPDVQMVISSWSLFAQDTWKVRRNLTATYGLRWEYNGAPSSPNGTAPFTVDQVSDLATATIAPAGTPLWHANKDDFAPRLGLAWQARSNLVLRAGAGVFYDLGYSDITNAMISFPYVQQKPLIFNTSFPLDPNTAKAPVFTPNPPAAVMSVIDPNHVLPRTYEWNTAVEDSIGRADVVTLTYAGAGGRKLMRKDVYIAPQLNYFTGEFDVLSNHGTSNYDALQAQYRHRLSRGLQTLLSYTWGHSIDDVSSDVNFQNVPLAHSSAERGPSDYDIRNTFSGAVSYDIPVPGDGVLKEILGNWSTDSIIYARSAPPANVVTGQNPFPESNLSGDDSVQRPDVRPNVPFYLYPSGAPGGKVLNPAAFTVPPTGTVEGDLGRNALRGFGATQWDLTLRRQFRFTERVSLQARGDFFNTLNHPNFGNPVNNLGSGNGTPNPFFGQSTQMLANYLGSGGQSGGLNPLYQIGGPRSIQLSLKLQF